MLDYGGILRPTLGGPDQRLNRLGNRFYLDVTLPPMTYDDGRIWIADLIRGQTEGVIFPWPQVEFDIGAPGNPLVNGAGQIGTTLSMDGFTPSYAVRKGQFLTIVSGGRRYLHIFTAQAVASTTGTLSASVAPMLRISPADNSSVIVRAPAIEGFIEGNERSWNISAARHVGLQFRITEAE